MECYHSGFADGASLFWDLKIKCGKEGQPLGAATAISRANGRMFGNILLGGGIGAIIDHNKGTAYNYPGWLQVTMGESLLFDRMDQTDEGIPHLGHIGGVDPQGRISDHLRDRG